MDINNMLDSVTKLEELFSEKCPAYAKGDKFKENVIAIASEITLLEELDQRFSTEEYKPQLDKLMVSTIRQTKQYISAAKPEVLIKLGEYLKMYVEYYYEQVENAMPIKMVGDVDGNDMFIDVFIDNNFDFFNE